MGRKVDYPELEIAGMARRQHGVVTQKQLREAGLSTATISRWVRRGRLHALHRAVYAVGHPRLSDEGRWVAAVLSCGRGAVLSHGAAASLWGLLRPLGGPIDVSVPTQAGRLGGRGVRLHRCRSLAGEPRLTTSRSGIPVTTPARTLADLPRTVRPALVRRARRQAEVLELPLGLGLETDRTRSDLERDFLRVCRRHGLPLPEVNARVGSWTVDFLWSDRRLVVETDGYRYHRGQTAFEDDRMRDLGLRARGHSVIRLSARQLREEEGAIVSVLMRELGRNLSFPDPSGRIDDG